jgi:uncharacterized protein YjbI with pentapeptide repeats
MANEEHLALLNQGVEVWNEWRSKNSEIKPNLSGVDLIGVDLIGVDLSGADLSGTDLSGTDLSRANLREANLSGTDLSGTDLSGKDLSGVNLSGANLSGKDLSGTYLSGANLSGANLSGANLSGVNLSGVNLSGANLSGVNLSGVNLKEVDLSTAILIGSILSGVNLSGKDLSGKDLSGANLSETNLSRIQALKTNFEGATFTGACIEDWNINSQTNLNNVICDYLYLKKSKQERRPHDPNKNFAPGEFTKLFQKALETVDLIFSEGIDWQAFLASFQKLQVECGSDELAIQAIEKKSGGAFIIRVEVPPDADKAEVEKYLKREYEIQLKDIEARYRLELNAKDKEIEIYKQQSADILELAKLAASRPINISQTQGNNMAGDRNIQMGSGNYNERIKGNYVQGNYYAPEQKQTLTEAAAEIQQLLAQLQSQGCSPEEAQRQAANDLATKAKNDSTTKEKLVKWGQSLGDTAAQTTVSEAAKEVVKLALRLSGVPLP